MLAMRCDVVDGPGAGLRICVSEGGQVRLYQKGERGYVPVKKNPDYYERAKVWFPKKEKQDGSV